MFHLDEIEKKNTSRYINWDKDKICQCPKCSSFLTKFDALRLLTNYKRVKQWQCLECGRRFVAHYTNRPSKYNKNKGDKK